MNIFQDIINAGKNLTSKVKEAIDWYRGKIKETKVFQRKSNPEIGNMYIFTYDAKHKDKLPIWDSYPLVFPINFYDDGFLGINLHYLPASQRATLLNALNTIATDDKYTDNTKLNISYQILSKSASKFSGYENCVKRYLYSHIRSSFYYVSPADWGYVALLPIEQWNRKSQR